MQKQQSEEGIQPIYIILTLIFLTFYAIVSSYLQHNHLPIHKSAVAIIVGMIAGFILFLSTGQNYQNITNFNDEVVYSVLYPPILFASGFNLKKKAFIKNMSYITMFGVLGTFFFFIVVVFLLYWANQLNLVRDAKDITNIRSLSIWQMLLLAACFCSIDTIASEQAISPRKYPKLFAIVFGQGILKDAVTIVLFRSIMKLEELETPNTFVFYWYTPIKIVANFVMLVASSSFQGVLMGVIIIYLFKRARFVLNNQGITQTCIVFLTGFCIYSISQAVSSSGVISVLVYGITLNHYGTYNMSQKGVQIAKSTFQFTSIICQGLLFLIMGIVVWQAQWVNGKGQVTNITHSYIFAVCVLGILLVGRAVNVLVIVGFGKLAFKKFSIKKEEIFILIVSGLVKGATPFALFTSVKLSSNSKYAKNQGMVLKTTIIIVIIATSVFLNSLIPKIFKKPLARMQDQAKEQVLAQSVSNIEKKKRFGTIRRFEQNYIKNFLIYDYQGRKQQINQIKVKNKKQEFIQTLKQFGQDQNSLLSQTNLDKNLLSLNQTIDHDSD